MTEISKTYEPQAVEEKWYAEWLAGGFFQADPSSTKPPYSIVIPPPNVTGVLTLGHVLNNTIQDILARRARMLGKEVLWLPGTDHAGIATQTVVERTLKKEGTIRHRDDLGREKFLEKVWEWKEKHGGIIIRQLKRLGASCDWSRERFTMDPAYSRCVQQVFVDLYNKGLIYRGKRMVNWDPSALTALSDEEVDMRPQNGTLYTFKVAIAERPGEFLSIATTRPETIPGDTAVAVNPKDPRYAGLIGLHVVRPLPAETRALLPIIGDEQVDFSFGTGVLKVTPAHDKTDFEIGQRHGLPAIDVMHPNGTMNDLAGIDLKGLDRFEARKIATEKLRELGLLEKEEPYQNNIGYSERAQVPIEPRLSEQWFLKYPSQEPARKVVADGAMRFHPERWGKVYDHWMSNLQDWCISRQLWWGHRVPVWYRARATQLVTQEWDEIGGATVPELRCNATEFVKRRGWLNQEFPNRETGWFIQLTNSSLRHAFSNVGIINIKLIPALPALIKNAVLLETIPHYPPAREIRCVHRFVAALQCGHALYRVKFTVKEFHTSRKLYDHQTVEVKKTEPGGEKSPEEAHLSASFAPWPAPGSAINVNDLVNGFKENLRETRCQIDSPGDGWTQDPDVLDTWFSSWLWPFATMGWPEKTSELAKFYPTSDLVTGPDIIFFWVARMIMAGFEFMGELPFRNVYFTGIIRDKQGRKMSKSLGNSPDPLDLIATYGADALRFGVMRSAPLGADVLFDEKNVELGRNFCTKLWNAVRFRQMQAGNSEGEIDPALLSSDDKWILLRLDAAITEITIALDEYRFSDAAQALYRFFWSEYCDWYLEASKAALASSDPALKANTLAVTDFVLGHTLRLMHPFLPFITEELWHGLGFNADMPADQGGRTIIFAPWPKPLDTEFRRHYRLDDADDRFAAAKYDTVTLGRGLRRDFNIASNKRIRFVLKTGQTLPTTEHQSLALLLNADPLEIVADYAPPRGTPVATCPLGDLFLPLEGLIDPAAERERLTKERTKVERELETVRRKLANRSFVDSAPAAVVEEHRQRERDWETKLERINRLIEAL
jgi:valyl-tRNA synthetase